MRRPTFQPRARRWLVAVGCCLAAAGGCAQSHHPVRLTDTSPAEEWVRRGKEDVDGEKFADAVRCFTEAIRLDPQRADAYYWRAHGRQHLDDPDGALGDLDEALRLDPGMAVAFNERGIARETKGDRAGALADYDAALKLEPGYVGARINRGNARLEQGDLAGALADLDEAVRRAPHVFEARLGRGMVREARADYAGALDDYGAAIKALDAADEAVKLKLQQKNAQVFLRRGVTRLLAGMEVEAPKDFAEFLKLRPDGKAAVEEAVAAAKRKRAARPSAKREGDGPAGPSPRK